MGLCDAKNQSLQRSRFRKISLHKLWQMGAKHKRPQKMWLGPGPGSSKIPVNAGAHMMRSATALHRLK